MVKSQFEKQLTVESIACMDKTLNKASGGPDAILFKPALAVTFNGLFISALICFLIMLIECAIVSLI